MKEKIFPVSSYVAINDDDGDVVVKTLPPHQQLPRRESQVRSVRKARREVETENLQDKNDHPIKKSEEEEDGEGGMAVLPVAGRGRNGNNFVH